MKGVKKVSTNMNILRGKLKERGMTQKELSEQIGMDPSSFSRKIASSGLKFTVGEMHSIAKALHLTPDKCKQIFLL